CSSSTVVRMVDDLIRKGPVGPSVESIRDHRELSYDPATGTRTGECVVETATGSICVTYAVAWLDSRAGHFQVQIVSLRGEDPPSCTDPEVATLVEQLIKNGPLGPGVLTVDEYRETSYDRPAGTRYGQCMVRTTRGAFRIAFKVQWLDQK